MFFCILINSLYLFSVMPIKLSQDEFLKRVQIQHPELDFSNSKYVNNRTPIEYSCPTHGVQFSRPEHLMNGHGCKKCGIVGTFARRLSQEDFLKRVSNIHPNLNFTKTNYINARTQVLYECPIHGERRTIPSSLEKHGCKLCGQLKTAGKRTVTTSEFKKRMKEIFPDYDFSNSEYIHNKLPVEYHCSNSDHGIQQALPNSLLFGHGCPKCSVGKSSGQTELKNVLEELGIVVVENYVLENGLHIDCFCPAYSYGFEYNGLYWHSEHRKAKDYHVNKTAQALKQGIRLVHIFEDEWLYKKNLVISRIKNLLGKSKKIGARSTTVQILEYEICREFLEANHIQGAGRPASIRLGLYHENNLVAVMTFGSPLGGLIHSSDYELIRFCSKDTVVGGFSKLLSFFKRNYNFKSLLSYSDKRWSIGNIYTINGFVFEATTNPGYFWCKGTTRMARHSFQKMKLEKALKIFDPSLTEVENCHANGYFRIYDCGHDVWILKA